MSDCEPPCERRPVTVPSRGTWLVVDGRVMEAEVDAQGYAGPQVHLITTREPWGGPSLAERIRAGVEQAEAGRTIDRGDFSNYLDGEEP